MMLAADSVATAEPLIAAQDVKKHFRVTSGFVFRKTIGQVRAVDGISFSIPQGETYSLVGESGCGKTTTAKVVLLVEELTSGRLSFRGQDIQAFTPEQLNEYRESVQAVFQDPWSSLNPRLKVESIIAEPLTAHRRLTKAELRSRYSPCWRRWDSTQAMPTGTPTSSAEVRGSA